MSKKELCLSYEKAGIPVIKILDMKGFELVMTCEFAPEQYDVCKDGDNVGYLRLRSGCFSASRDGDIVYEACPSGINAFEPDEREKYLRKAVKAIRKRMIKESNSTVLELWKVNEQESSH